jgi:hypothetical protein
VSYETTLWLGLGTMVFVIVARKHALMFIIPLVIAMLLRLLLQHVYHPG